MDYFVLRKDNLVIKPVESLNTESFFEGLAKLFKMKKT